MIIKIVATYKSSRSDTPTYAKTLSVTWRFTIENV